LIKAKIAFEKFAESCGISVSHYHPNNVRFVDNAFIMDAKEQGQSISYCRVNAHHQDGKVEKRIRDLQVQARVMIIHEMNQWNDAAAPRLWPYAVRLANEIINMTHRSKDGKVPLSIFSNSSQSPGLETLHPFGCPVYILENALQQGNKIVKWENRSRIRMYLGPSPRHARSVHLILSIKTGLVSPQFHVSFDDFFESTKWDEFMPRSEWKYKSRITEEKASNTLDLDRNTITKLLCPNPNNNSNSPIDQGGNLDLVVQNDVQNDGNEQRTAVDYEDGEEKNNNHEEELDRLANSSPNIHHNNHSSTDNSPNNHLNDQITYQGLTQSMTWQIGRQRQDRLMNTGPGMEEE